MDRADGPGQPGSVFDAWLQFSIGSGHKYWGLDRKGDRVLCMTWVEIEPGAQKGPYTRRDIYYHVWNGDRHEVTQSARDAYELWDSLFEEDGRL